MNNLEIPKVPVIKSKAPDDTGSKKKYKVDWFTKTFSADLTLYLHLFVYASVIGLCLMLNLMHFNGRLWTITAALGWLVGLSTHFTLYLLFKEDMLNKEEGLEGSFYIHLSIYISTNILLIWSNFAKFEGWLWFPIAAAGWGIAIGVHFLISRYAEV
jgi:hypothetical protein